jgi:hypothetical protein
MQKHHSVLVPLLGSVYHSHPRRGGCLLELVSTIPGGPWTARPTAIDPVLGTLARAVNDGTSSDQRAALAQLIPWLALLPSGNRITTRNTVVTSVVAVAAASASAEVLNLMGAEAAAACTEEQRWGLRRAWARHTGHRSAIRAVRLAAESIAFTRGDDGLRDLLIGAVNEVRCQYGLPPLPLLIRPAAECRAVLSVRSELRAPDGGDSTYIHWTSVPSSWPSWLVDGWCAARDEVLATRNLRRQADMDKGILSIELP